MIEAKYALRLLDEQTRRDSFCVRRHETRSPSCDGVTSTSREASLGPSDVPAQLRGPVPAAQGHPADRCKPLLYFSFLLFSSPPLLQEGFIIM